MRFDLKLRDTIKIVIRKATIYGAWMSSNTVSTPSRLKNICVANFWTLHYVEQLTLTFTILEAIAIA